MNKLNTNFNFDLSEDTDETNNASIQTNDQFLHDNKVVKIPVVALATSKKEAPKTKHKKKLVIDANYNFEPKSKFMRFLRAIVWYFVVVILKAYNRIWLGLKIKNKRIINDTKKKFDSGIITVSNHINIMDCSMNADITAPRRMFLTTIQDNLTIPFAGKLVKLLLGVPIPKEEANMRYFLKFTERKLKEKRIVHYYPEGELRPYCNKIMPFHKGAFLQSYRANVPIIPIVYVQRKVKGPIKLFRKTKCFFTAIVCEPMFCDFSLAKKQSVLDLEMRVKQKMELVLKENSQNIVKANF